MRAIKVFAALVFLILAASLQGQNGTIRGTVYDDATGEYLPGVTIFLEGTTLGTLTDLDGKFNLSAPAGNYDLRVSFISYEAMIIKGIRVEEGDVTLFDNLRLKEATVELTEVVIAAQGIRNTENALLTLKRKSANVIDGISATGFKKIGDSDAAASMKRVTGVSVEGGKYVYVRGLGDRYTKTILNGVDIPGLDPDRNTIQMDIFPTNIIDNIIVHKSFSADLPADFTGGVIDIAIKDFPEERKGSIAFGLAYNPGFHFRSDYLTYEGGKTDWLGYDDGTRAIPATENIPQFVEAYLDPNGDAGLRYKEILGGFNTTLAAREQTSLMDYNIGATYGNQHVGNIVTLGYNFSLSYKSNTEMYKNAEYGRYGLTDSNTFEMDVREYQKGNFGVSSVLWSGMAGFAVKTKASKYRINIVHLQNGESRAAVFEYQGSDQGSIFGGFQHNLEYSQRSLTNLIISGKHNLAGSEWEIEWKLSPTLSKMYDPDIRFTRCKADNGKFIIGTETGFPERIWRDLEEISYAGIVSVTRQFDLWKRNARVMFGGAYTSKERDFIIRNYAINIRNVPLTGDPDEIFSPENLWPYNGNLNYGTSYEAAFYPNNANRFNSGVRNMAGYVSAEVSPFDRLKAIIGVRVENYVQRYTGQNQQGTIVPDNEKVLDNTGFFPALNLIYALNEQQNLRFSYARTIARPSFKELSYAEIYDPISGRTFIGGLFRDADEQLGIEYWDGNLVSTDIDNIDLRWELYKPNGQMVSVSAFCKMFDNPIEIVQYAVQAGSFQPRNVGDGQVFGAELEFRFNLINISQELRNLSLSSNLTYTRSFIRMSNVEFQSRVDNARVGETVGEYRDMAGQAPYIINLGLSYDGGEKGFWNGFEAGLFYNVQGKTLQYVGMVDRPDIYALPFNSLNFNSNKSFGKNNKFQVGIKAENILADWKDAVFISYMATDQYFSRLLQGITFQIRFSYSFF
ncbi:MAG TPA: TonB-dependent receptor [Bacteroidales bacterium]|nr:TonB-dependent receptor [Bacteroidales bacterium]